MKIISQRLTIYLKPGQITERKLKEVAKGLGSKFHIEHFDGVIGTLFDKTKFRVILASEDFSVSVDQEGEVMCADEVKSIVDSVTDTLMLSGVCNIVLRLSGLVPDVHQDSMKSSLTMVAKPILNGIAQEDHLQCVGLRFVFSDAQKNMDLRFEPHFSDSSQYYFEVVSGSQVNGLEGVPGAYDLLANNIIEKVKTISRLIDK